MLKWPLNRCVNDLINSPYQKREKVKTLEINKKIKCGSVGKLANENLRMEAEYKTATQIKICERLASDNDVLANVSNKSLYKWSAV